MSARTVLLRDLAEIGITLTSERLAKLVIYLEELEHWNRAMNLTALRGQALVRRLVTEPCWIGEELQISGKLADVGSGNGCPGIPLTVVRNLEETHLIEARTKRGVFLRHLAKKLDLNGVVVHRARVQEIPPRKMSVDWISLQGVEPDPRLLRSLRHFCHPTTRVVWITSRGSAPASDAQSFSVPGSTTQAWVFELDQF